MVSITMGVVFATERLEHAHAVAGIGDRGAEALADRFSGGAVAEVVVAAGAGGLEHDLDLPGVACELDDRVAGGVERRECERVAIDAAGVELVE